MVEEPDVPAEDAEEPAGTVLGPDPMILLAPALPSVLGFKKKFS